MATRSKFVSSVTGITLHLPARDFFFIAQEAWFRFLFICLARWISFFPFPHHEQAYWRPHVNFSIVAAWSDGLQNIGSLFYFTVSSSLYMVYGR